MEANRQLCCIRDPQYVFVADILLVFEFKPGSLIVNKSEGEKFKLYLIKFLLPVDTERLICVRQLQRNIRFLPLEVKNDIYNFK